PLPVTGRAGEPRLAWSVAQERGHPALLVLGGEQPGDQAAFQAQPGGQRGVQTVVDRLLDRLQRQPWSFGQLPGVCGGRGQWIVGYLVYQTDAQRLLRGDFSARHHQLLRPRRADLSRESLGTSRAGRDAEPYLRLADLGVRSGDPVVGRQGQFEAAAERETVQGGDNRKGEFGDPGEGLLQRPVPPDDLFEAERRQLLQVRSRGETPAFATQRSEERRVGKG